MDEDKLKRYLHNASYFLWGACGYKKDKNQGGIYDWISERVTGFPYNSMGKATYDEATNWLIDNIGIEGIIKQIILPYLKEKLSPNELEFLRRCWKGGKLPTGARIEAHNLLVSEEDKIDQNEFYNHCGETHILEFYSSEPKFVQCWGQLGYGLWWEEIEPWIK